MLVVSGGGCGFVGSGSGVGGWAGRGWGYGGGDRDGVLGGSVVAGGGGGLWGDWEECGVVGSGE